MASRRHVRPPACVALVLAMLLPLQARAEWKAVEKVETYAVSGASGAELYASIGENGPMIGGGRRAIAHTTFKLTWRRDYQKRGQACVLATAQPKLIITYTLPQPSGPLSGMVRASWADFIAGLEKHERIHGLFISEMVRDIEAASIGLSADEDPDCRKVRAELQRRLGELSGRQRQRGRDFDREEMSSGGNVHRLILDLVGGP